MAFLRLAAFRWFDLPDSAAHHRVADSGPPTSQTLGLDESEKKLLARFIGGPDEALALIELESQMP